MWSGQWVRVNAEYPGFKVGEEYQILNILDGVETPTIFFLVGVKRYFSVSDAHNWLEPVDHT